MNLVVVDVTDSAASRVFRVKRFPALIGNRCDAEVSVAHDGVSRLHAEIVRRDSRYYVVDLGSRNGTRLHRVRGGDLVSKSVPVAPSAEGVDEGLLGAENELRDGSYVAVGACILKCLLEPDAPLARMEVEADPPEPEGHVARLTGLIGACALLVAVTLALGFRNAKTAPEPGDNRSPIPVQETTASGCWK